MKDIKQQIKDGAFIVLSIGVTCMAISILASMASANDACTPPAHKPVAKRTGLKRVQTPTTIVIQNCGSEPATKEVVVTKTVVVEVEAPKKRNSISLLGVANPTSLSVTNNGAGSYSYQNSYQADAGAMYQRDLNDTLRATVGGTIRGTVFLGAGVNF